MKKFSRTFTNKLVSFADRYYTWDKRTLRREGTDKCFDFFAFNKENKTCICIDNTKMGMWVAIKKNDDFILAKHLHTYKEIDNFKKMIRCLG